MEEDRLSNAAFSLAALQFLGECGLGGVPQYEEKLAAAIERERRDPVPRSDTEKILRRQMPVSIPEPDGPDDRAGGAGPWGTGEPVRWFRSRRARIRAEAYIGLGGLLTVLVYVLTSVVMDRLFAYTPAGNALIAVSIVGFTAAFTVFLAFAALFMELHTSVAEGDDEAERAVALLVSGQRD